MDHDLTLTLAKLLTLAIALGALSWRVAITRVSLMTGAARVGGITSRGVCDGAMLACAPLVLLFSTAAATDMQASTINQVAALMGLLLLGTGLLLASNQPAPEWVKAADRPRVVQRVAGNVGILGVGAALSLLFFADLVLRAMGSGA